MGHRDPSTFHQGPIARWVGVGPADYVFTKAQREEAYSQTEALRLRVIMEIALADGLYRGHAPEVPRLLRGMEIVK